MSLASLERKGGCRKEDNVTNKRNYYVYLRFSLNSTYVCTTRLQCTTAKYCTCTRTLFSRQTGFLQPSSLSRTYLGPQPKHPGSARNACLASHCHCHCHCRCQCQCQRGRLLPSGRGKKEVELSAGGRLPECVAVFLLPLVASPVSSLNARNCHQVRSSYTFNVQVVRVAKTFGILPVRNRRSSTPVVTKRHVASC